MLTTENMVFKPGVDSINLEVMVLNKEVDELRFMLEISESNATTGQVKELLVSLAKTDLDRICTTWEWYFTEWAALVNPSEEKATQFLGSKAKVSYDANYEEINISGFQGWGTTNGYPLFFGYDHKNNIIECTNGKTGTYYTGYYYDENNDIFEIWFNITEDEKIAILNDAVTAQANEEPLSRRKRIFPILSYLPITRISTSSPRPLL